MEFSNSKSIYVQIADFMCDGILMGKWAPNEKIISIRDLAVELEVNPNTTMRAFENLQNRGIIFNKRGIGYFVAEDAVQKVKALRREEFVSDELPKFFKSIALLDITFEELSKMYNEYKINLSK